MRTKKKHTDDEENQQETVSDDIFTFKRQHLSDDETISMATRPESRENPAIRTLDEIRAFVDHVKTDFQQNMAIAKTRKEKEEAHPFHHERIDWCAKKEREHTSKDMICGTGVLGHLEPRVRELIDSGDLPAEIFENIFEMGQIWERLKIRFLGNYRKRRLAEQKGVKKSGINRQKVDTEEIILLMNEYKKAHPQSSRDEAAKKIAADKGVCERTVFNHWKKRKV